MSAWTATVLMQAILPATLATCLRCDGADARDGQYRTAFSPFSAMSF
jgi:hypothetical protein